MKATLFDSSSLSTAQEAFDFESSTKSSVIGKDLDGKILLWNEGACRTFVYEPDETVGQLNAGVLRSPEDMASAKPKELMRVALEREKWEDVIRRVREDGRRITSRVVTAFSVMRTRASDLHGQAQP
jgi:PAS domain S-box-containing protein